jgi:predicted AAA+ superfamily ATPase
MRYLQPHIIKDLQKKMVFIGGPRQCGKTTLAQQILSKNLAKNRQGLYFNWDDTDQRESILKKQWDDPHKLIVFDELHKFPRWKNWLKGIYDIQKKQHSFLVTGSARLDVYRRGGDSMFGRYHYWRLHPFTLSELPVKMKLAEAYRRLMTVGGFPEPFLDGNETAARRWRHERFDRVLRDDVRDLEPLRDIPTLSLFVEQLRRRVGGMIVLSNLANELQVAPKTVKHWLTILEKMYLVFVVYPLTQNISRAVLKPPKVYFFDNADVIGDEGVCFENLVATHLLKRLNFLEDRDGYRYELRFIRDKEGREVDFAILRDGVVTELIEAKLSDNKISTSLRYYSERLHPEQSLQIVGKGPNSYKQGRLTVAPVLEVLAKPLG